MKRSKKIFLRILPVLMVCLVLFSFSFVFADEPIKPEISVKGNASSKVSNLTGNMWATVTTVIQVLAIAAVVFAGLRYMFASADQKADIKKQLIILVIGAVLVFGATTVLKVIADVTNQVTNNS